MPFSKGPNEKIINKIIAKFGAVFVLLLFCFLFFFLTASIGISATALQQNDCSSQNCKSTYKTLKKKQILCLDIFISIIIIIWRFGAIENVTAKAH